MIEVPGQAHYDFLKFHTSPAKIGKSNEYRARRLKTQESRQSGMILITFTLQLIISVIVCAHVVVERPDEFFELLLCFLFCLATLSTYVVLRRDRNKLFHFFSNRRHLLMLIGISLFGLAARIYHLSAFSIWYDEDAQVTASLGNSRLILNAAADSQPPIGYFFSWAAVHLFGYTEFAARITSAILGGLLVFQVSAIIYRITKSALWSSFGGILVALNPWLIYYSQEARPQSISLSLFAIYLFSMLEFMLEEFNWRLLIVVLTTAFFYLSSIGFQAPMALVCLNISLALIFFRRERKKTVYFLIANLIAGVLFLPFYMLIKSASAPYLQTPTLELALSYPAAWKETFSKLILELFNLSPHGLLFTGYFVPLLAIIVFALFKTRKSSPHWQFLRIFAATGMMFTILATFSFHMLVRWPIQARYFIVLIPVIIVAIGVSAWTLSPSPEWWTKHLTPIRRLFLKAALSLLMMILFFFSLPVYTSRPIAQDWRGIYKIIEEESIPSAVVFVLIPAAPKDFEVTWLIDERFYLSETLRKRLDWFSLYQWRPGSQVDVMFSYFESNKQPSHVILILKTEGDQKSPSNELTSEPRLNYRVRHFEGFDTIAFDNNDGTEESMKHLMMAFDRAIGPLPYNQKTYEFLTRYSLRKKDCAESKRYFGLYQEATAKTFIAERTDHLRSQIAELCAN